MLADNCNAHLVRMYKVQLTCSDCEAAIPRSHCLACFASFIDLFADSMCTVSRSSVALHHDHHTQYHSGSGKSKPAQQENCTNIVDNVAVNSHGVCTFFQSGCMRSFIGACTCQHVFQMSEQS